MFINILLNFRLFSKQSISAHKFFNGILFYTSCCHARFARPAIQSAPVMLTNNSTELFFTTHGHKRASRATGLRPYYKCFVRAPLFYYYYFFLKNKRSNVEAVEAVEGRNEILWNENDDDNKRGGSGILTLLTLHPPHTHTF